MILKKIEKEDRKILENLFQLYMHDITKDLAMEVNEEGLFEYSEMDDYFTQENHFAYLILEENKIAGFVMINDKPMALESGNNLSEFFILNTYKGKGLGKKVALEIFNMFKGDWEVKPVPRSKGAETFWEKVIKEYTNNNFEILFPKPNRKAIIFNNKRGSYDSTKL